MSQTSPDSSAQSAGPVIEPGFESVMQAFWERNRRVVLAVCVIGLLAIVAREAWQYYSRIRERGVQADYSSSVGKSDKLLTFASKNASHVLGGVAYLQLADEKFSSGDYKQALGLYQKAAGALKNDALLGRARLGAAVSQIFNGDTAAGEASLRAIGSDQALLKSVRAEATYHLASLAIAANKHEDAQRLVAEVGKIDPAGAWFQRATMLLANLPSTQKASETPPPLTFKPGGN
jgi:tetratricopeptide (TPR) repeat protein